MSRHDVPRAFTQDRLNVLQCQTPGCSHKNDRVLFLHPRCHAGAGTEVSYERNTGELTVKCARCKKLVCNIAVAQK